MGSQPAPRPIRVRKLRPDGSQAFAWEAEVLRHRARSVVLAARFNVDAWEVAGTRLVRGDAFREFYYADRWYNVFQVSSPEGVLKGWYANVGTPARWDLASGDLAYVDLALDLWVSADGHSVRLDEDEFALLRPTLPVDLQAGAERGWAQLLALAEEGRLPRWVDRG